jgi:hypothetical protein
MLPKPCAHCDCPLVEMGTDSDVRYAVYVQCPNCRARGPAASDADEAVARWNHRPREGAWQARYAKIVFEVRRIAELCKDVA